MNTQGFRSIHHIAWTVPDIERVSAFYQRLFGANVLYRLGPLDVRDIPHDTGGRDWSESHLGVRDARLSIVMLQFPDGFRLELFSYERPAGDRSRPLESPAIGAHHLGIQVDDIESASAELSANGCQLFEIIALDEGPTAGSRFRYFTDPWMNILELVEINNANTSETAR